MYKQDFIELLVTSVVLLFVFFVGLKIMFGRRKAKADSDGELGKIPQLPVTALQKKGILTPEESARVAEALKRAYLGEKKAGASVPAAATSIATPAQVPASLPADRKPMGVPQTEPMDGTPKPKLPERLRHLLDSSDADLDQLRQAGFLSEEDEVLLDRFLNHERRR